MDWSRYPFKKEPTASYYIIPTSIY